MSSENVYNETSLTTNNIMNILQQISISPPGSPYEVNGVTPIITGLSTSQRSNKSSLQHFHSLPKSIRPKRRLSSSSSFSTISTTPAATTGNNFDKNHKRQIVNLRGLSKLQSGRLIPSPFSRSFLIQRLNTFSVFNWTIDNPKLSPLACALQGWKCHAVRKNELHCTGCHAGIIIKLPEVPGSDVSTYPDEKKVFNNQHHMDDYNQVLNNTERYELQFEFKFLDDELDEDEDDYNDDIHIYETLVNSFTSRLINDHYPTCPFVPFVPLTPKDENYYLSPKDISRELNKFTNRLLILMANKNRLIGRNFKTQFLSSDERIFLLEYLRESSRQNDTTIATDIEDEDGIKNGITCDYETDQRVNPCLDVILPALLGWELKVQTFHNKKFLLLNCECCTRRILLSSTGIESVKDIEELKPCPYRAEIPAREQLTEFDETIGIRNQDLFEEDYDEELIDLELEHDTWCCMKAGWRIVLEGLRSITDVDLKNIHHGLHNDEYRQTIENLRSL